MPKTSLFIFRRDLRLHDNTALLAACAASEAVIPAFIFDPRQCNPDKNRFFSKHAFAFLIESLSELDRQLARAGGRLQTFEGAPEVVVRRLLAAGGIDAVYVNRDYTPFSRQRDAAVAAVCEDAGVSFERFGDALLSEPEDVQKRGGKAYHVFSRFRRAAQKQDVPRPGPPANGPFVAEPLAVDTVHLAQYDRYPKKNLLASGGRAEGARFLTRISALTGYRDKRHRPEEKAFTGLSAHHKFGTVSIRESYWAVRDAHEGYHKLISQLYWRDFYTHLLFHRPEQLNEPLRPLGRYVDWVNDRPVFDRWCAGETGIPFVDAGMRELNATGYMHNRARMTVASVLTKDLLTDWRWGAQYFARTLTDYDPAVNAGNWQWAASVGTDYKLRIYNPYLQAKKHDPDASYIKQWVPELRAVPAERLTDGAARDFSDEGSYPPPIVDRNDAYHRAKEAFSAARDRARR